MWAWKRFAQEEAAACPTLTRIANALDTSHYSLLPSDCWKQLLMLGRACRPSPPNNTFVASHTQHNTLPTHYYIHARMHRITTRTHYHTHSPTRPITLPYHAIP